MAEFGSLDPNDWREQEAQEGLALQQKDAEALAAKQRSWADTGRSVLSAPYRLAKSVVTDPVGAISGVGSAIKSGLTAPGDAMSGAIPEYVDGHTSPEMVHRAFDTAAIAGGGSVAGTTEALPKLAADSAKAGAPIAAAEHAPPFYSALEHAVAEHPQEVAPAKQWLGTLSNKPGVKPDELKYTGTADMLAAKGDAPVTKAELQDHLEQNKIQLGEVTKGQMPEKWQDVPGDQRYAVSDVYNDLGAHHSQPDLPEWYENIAQHSREGNETGLDKVFQPAKFADYQLPGGANYREKLLTLPRKEVTTGDISQQLFGKPMANLSEAERDAVVSKLRETPSQSDYRSSHWDEPNVLAHLRMNDRDVASNGFVVRNQVSGNTSQHFPDQAAANAYIDKLPENLQRQVNIVPSSEAKPSLHLEEIQSDWHQEGRQKGYAGESPPPLTAQQISRVQEIMPQLEDMRRNGMSLDQVRETPLGQEATGLQDIHRAFNAYQKRGDIPDAPFKKNWHELALKRALHDAAEGGYERLSWTPGEAQAARYDLSKQVDEIRVAKRPDGNYTLSYLPKGSRDGDYFQPLAKGVAAEKLADHVGKDLAEKILQDKSVDRIGTGTFSGGDLKVGGEGMKGFYDKIVPDYLNKVGKPHGAQVRSGVTGSPEFRLIDEEGKPGQSFPTAAAGNAWLARNPEAAKFWSLSSPAGQPVHYMDIPPSLKQQLLTKGMPLFEDSAAAALPIAASEHARVLAPKMTPPADPAAMPELQRAAGADPNTAPHPGAKYPQYAEQYPPVGPPQLMDKATGKPLPNKGKAAQKLVDQGKAYWGKQNTPEAQAFQKDRAAIQKEMEAKGYDPFFPPEERSHADPANYPTPLDMTKDALPAKQATIDKYREMFSTPEAHARLQKAFDVGKTIPGADNWYAMRQLEQQYIKHLGPEEGRKRFANEFAHTMAATTGGADPTSNLLLAHYVQWAQKNHGAIPEASYEHPFPIGGRYVSGNIDQFRKMPEGGFTENNPKRHDFGHAFLGHPNKATMDEQMSGGLVPGMSIPPGDSYGVAAQIVHDLAAKNGVHPRDFQDITWAGLKKLKTEEAGKKFSYKGPMITDVNDAIERTHRLTGMPRNEVVKRALVKKEIPLYVGGVPMGSLNPQDDQ